MVQANLTPLRSSDWHNSSPMTKLGEFAERFMLRIVVAGDNTHLPKLGSATCAKIRAHQMHAIISLTPIMVLANLVTVFALILVLEHHDLITLPVVAWGGLVTLCSFSFLRSTRRIQASGEWRPGTSRGIGIIVRNAAVCSFLWAIPLFSFLPSSTPVVQGLIIALTGVIVSGGTIAFYPVPLAAYVFSTVMTVVGITGIIIIGHEHVVSWLALGTAFLMVTTRAIQYHAGVFLDEIIQLMEMSETRSLNDMLLSEYELNSDNLIWECDAALKVVKCSGGLARRFDSDADAINGVSFIDLLAPVAVGPSGADIQMLGIAMRTHVPVSGLVVGCSFGSEHLFWKIHGLPQVDHEGAFCGYKGFAIDVTREEAAKKRIEFLATRDALTGLLNKTEFLHRIEAKFESLHEKDPAGWQVSLAFIDSDGLKAVNDTFGHAAGDAMIREIGRRLRELTGPNSMIARIGGDEFLVAEVHHDLLIDQVRKRYDRVTKSLSLPFTLEGMEIRMSASLGLDISSLNDVDIDRMQKRADRALYFVKQQGGQDSVLYNDQIGQPIARRRELSTDLARAIRQGEITVCFQPIIHTQSFLISGYEALARWTRRDGTEVSPEEFISAAEESGQIVLLGNYVLNRTFAAAAQWDNQYNLSVNVSVLQLQYREFASDVKHLLERHNLSPDRVVLEIVESKLLQTSPVVQENLRQINQMGLKLAIDDFGKGYSSFAYLREFSVSSLKIDRSMTAGLVESEAQRSIVKAIIGVAQAFNLTTIAEGVETAEQFRIIREMGCDAAQGFLIGRPQVSIANPTSCKDFSRAPALEATAVN